LIEPPSRSTAWRYGFKTPPNYNDHELFCGGFHVQWSLNKGKCGICGDPYNGKRENELPNGIYAKNLVVTRSYDQNSVITAKVQLTANHNGHFVFKICPATSKRVEVTQKCLDSNVLEVLNSKDKRKYILPSPNPGTFEIRLRLPRDLTCERCVLQWTYTAANNWGTCEDGTGKVGCGPQETFRACADIRIGGQKGSNSDDRRRAINFEPEISRETDFEPEVSQPRDDDEGEEPKRPESGGGENCVGTGAYAVVPGMDNWCKINCAAGFCPPTHCSCS
ncbi:uncharacterized protein B4U79_02654, partial [Dinothrombium tinctorium]